jgi:O-antigen/teichoic acid export membrane protein
MRQTNSNNKVFANLFWRFAERCGAQVIQFIVQIVLARILAPEAYGTIALVVVFANIFQVFVDSGLANALIQKKNADDLDFSSVFYFNLVWCLILYGILFCVAPAISNFYNNVELVPIIRVLCLTVVISGLKNVQQAYVSKTLQFKKFFWATLIGTLLSAIAGIVMAYRGFGVWALVAQRLINLAVDTLALWIMVDWRPKLMFSFERLRGLISYGWKLLASALLDTVYNNLWQMIIGKVYTESDLAYYNQGNQFPNVIVTNVNTSIDSVLLPVMSNEQDDRNRVREMTRRAIKTSTYVMAPLMMGLAFTATAVVELLLTEKWLPCVFFLRVFCITYMFYPIHTANLNAIKALGRSDIFLKLEILKKVVGIVLLFITVNIGVKAMAYSLLLSSVSSQIINSWPNRRLLGYNYLEQLKDILPNIILAVVMGVIVYCINFIGLAPIITLLIQVPLGLVIYLIGSIITKNDSFYYLLKIISPVLNKLRKRG